VSIRVVCLGLVAATAAACGGSSSGGTPAASSPPSSAAPSASAPTNQPANASAAKAEITTNWAKFLSSDTSSTEAKTLLEKGDQLGPALKKATAEDKATGGNRSAKVTKITFTSPTQANVSYLLHAAGQTLHAAGIAVLEDGVWKVSDITFCTLVVLGNGSRPVKGCAS
jgi:hypothetical protein